MLVFAQKYEPVPMCLFVQETALDNSAYSVDPLETSGTGKSASITLNIHNTFNSNYLTLEVFGLSKAIPFQVINTQGEEMYSGTISGTQLIETESWPVGTYYFLCGNRR
jgi:hypothetical protein